MAVPNIGASLQIQMALQRRLRALDTPSPGASMFPGAQYPPQGRFPPVAPLPPIGGLRTPRTTPKLRGQMPSYNPLPRYY